VIEIKDSYFIWGSYQT